MSRGGLAFETYVGLMRPWAERLVRRRAIPSHPFLSREDLLQEGLTALWEVWKARRKDLPQEELCRLGTTAMKCRIFDQFDRARTRGRGRGTETLSLDAPGPEGMSIGLSEVLGGGEAVDELLLRLGLQEIERTLGAVERNILHEVLSPGAKTLRVLQRIWRARHHPYWSQVRTRALAAGLGLSEQEVRSGWRHVRRQILHLVEHGCPSRSRYQKQDPILPQEEQTMSKVSADELAPPEPSGGAPAAPAPAAPAEGGKVNKKTDKKAKPAKTEKKPKPEKKAKPPKTEKKAPGPVLAVGTKVRYLGGSRAKDVKKGETGVIKHQHGKHKSRYAIKFESGKSSIVAGKFVEKA